MDKQIKNLNACITAINNFSTNTRKTKKDKQTKGFLLARKLLLQQYWDKYVTGHEDITSTPVTESDEGLKAFLSVDDYESVEIKYAETMGEINDLLEASTSSDARDMNISQSLPSPSHQTSQSLPRIKIPPFDGTFLQWYPFKDLFTSIVTNNPTLTNTQRLQYLKDSLVSDACHTLDTNFSVAWELLESRYENKRVIINAHLTEITKLPTAIKESSNNLRIILDSATSSIRALKQLGRPVEHWDDWLVFTIVHKLDAATRKAWELSLKSNTDIPTFAELTTFMTSRTQSLEIVQSCMESKSEPKGASYQKSKPTQAVKNYHTSSGRCPGCAGKHIILFCNDFREKSPQQRYNFIVQAKMCINCMRYGHQVKTCSSDRRCQKCNNLHHTMLHEYFNRNANDSTCDSNQNVVSSLHTILATKKTIKQRSVLPPVLIGTALVEIHSVSGKKITLRALLDSGAEATFISEYAVSQLQIAKSPVKVPVNGASGNKIAMASGIVNFILRSLKTSFEMNCVALVLPRIGNLTPSAKIPPEKLGDFWNLDLADPQLNMPGSIDIILSASDYASVILNDVKRSHTNNTIAQRTQLGWVIFGGLSDHKLYTTEAAYDCYCTRIELDQTLRNFWELEELNVGPALTRDEVYCENFFNLTTTRDDSGRYVVRLPIKKTADISQLASTRSDAVSLLHYMQRRLNRNPEMSKMYTEFMSEYHSLGHMEIIESSNKVCYLPHHGVLKEASTTTKLRVVFNASKKSSSGVSLNDCLHIGPKLQNDLTAVVLNWRRYRIAFTGDIEKMYRQVLVDQRDADLQRIVWQTPEQFEPTSYRLLTITYGTNCAPYLAIKVLRTLATDEQQNFPNASKTLIDDFYVDDVLSGADDPSEATRKREELQALLKAGGFILRKWNSNSVDVLEKIDIIDRDHKDSYDLNLDAEAKALGIVWLTRSDQFTYKINLDYNLQRFTKRQLLSDVAKLFDPLGFLAPVIIRGKIFFQQLWLTGLNWNDMLPDNLQEEWIVFRNELKYLHEIRIPRWVHITSQIESYELHAFADASKLAYAAVLYLKVSTNSEVYIDLLMSKTKVAPLKETKIARLELCAALLAAKLLKKGVDTLKLKSVTTYLWSDSTTTLWWIRTDPGKLKEFVSNRVVQIQDLTSTSDWKYVPTADNPADCASRGLSPQQLLDHTLWWFGPQWLRLTEADWPQQLVKTPDISPPESKAVQVLVTQITSDNLSMIENYSSLEKLLTVTAWCRRFINAKCGKPHETESFCLWVERHAALQSWLKAVQREAFGSELNALNTGKLIPKKSKLRKMYPTLDHEGILRYGGRLGNANLSFNERFPCILPKSHTFTNLIIRQAHEQVLHGGTQATLHQVQQRYWIIDGRTVVKRILRNCVRCFRQKCSPYTQVMGNLPAERCNVSPPFTHTGVDYAGPFNIRTSKGRGHRSYKGYVALFVCFATRAIHLELVSDMTTDAFIAAMNRFVSIRGICSHMHSDRGTTFVGADALMKDELKAFAAQLKAGAMHASKIGINWHFIPPAAPNFGGLWEAGVKSMKFHLKRVVNTATLTFEEFYTVLKQIESCLNSRPISAKSDDPSDLAALTPGHFLIGRALTAIPEPCLLDAKSSHLTRWKQLKQMHQDFWRRWSCEYLPQLQKRNKWQQHEKNIAVGQLVLLRDERSPPTHWPLGRVIETHAGEDGAIRVVTIKTQSTTLKRPISKLSILPIDPTPENGIGGRSGPENCDRNGGRSPKRPAVVAEPGRGGRKC